jgi:hypothetical protein
MSDLSGKRIAVDISIYLYKYEAENALLENMYVMLSIFRHYNITPIFIFDGKPPPEKKALLQKRREDREEAQQEYEQLEHQLKHLNKDDGNNKERQEIIENMTQLKKQMTQINKKKMEKVKSLIRAYGATYFDAPEEADELCAMLVMEKKVWACLSEDMDLFVYGCTRVLRYFSLLNHNAILYYMKGILDELHMTQDQFKEICVLSGTDYNVNANTNATNTNPNLHSIIKQFRKYQEENTGLPFYNWLINTTKYVTNLELLQKIVNMFNLSGCQNKLDIFKNIKIINGPIKQDDIQSIMKEEGFIFC